uniref:Predicted protein n=1 Tax=Hordeum vulgare subsp. vulgare TaxID=112509 RepID=F2D6G2_HORVV|nr:predicted protein [Hordeum vulgare subsp. vulgare]
MQKPQVGVHVSDTYHKLFQMLTYI